MSDIDEVNCPKCGRWTIGRADACVSCEQTPAEGDMGATRLQSAEGASVTEKPFVEPDPVCREIDEMRGMYNDKETQAPMETAVQKIANELTTKISGQIDAHLFESIVSLFNSRVLVHYIQSPRTIVNESNFNMTVEAASGVRFEGREKIIALEKERDELQKTLESYGDIDMIIQERTHERDELKAEVERLKADYERVVTSDITRAGENASLREEIAALRAAVGGAWYAEEYMVENESLSEADEIRDAREKK